MPFLLSYPACFLWPGTLVFVPLPLTFSLVPDLFVVTALRGHCRVDIDLCLWSAKFPNMFALDPLVLTIDLDMMGAVLKHELASSK